MFKLPKISAWGQGSSAQNTFLGINKTFNVGEGEFSDMLNMSSEHYPALAPRAPRHWQELPDFLAGATVLDVITKGEDVYYVYAKDAEDGAKKEILFRGGSMSIAESIFFGEAVDDVEFIHAVMNNRIFVSPKGDPKGVSQFVYDTANSSLRQVQFDEYRDSGEGGKGFVQLLGDLLFQINVEDMDKYLEAGDCVRVTFPKGINGSNGGDHLCLVQSVNSAFFVVSAFDSEMGSASGQAEDIRLQREGVRLDYVTSYMNRLYGVAKYEKTEELDPLTITSASILRGNELLYLNYSKPNNGGSLSLLEAQKYKGRSWYVQEYGKEYTIALFSPNVDGISSITFDSLSAKLADKLGWKKGSEAEKDALADLVGKTLVPFVETERVDNIFASVLGSPASWTNYEETSMGAFNAPVASDSEWTGIKVFDGSIWCFKEDSVFQCYGTERANFGYNEIKYTGIKKGSSASAHIIGTTMFYHSKNGMAALSSGSFGIFSNKLGEKELSNVKCSSVGDRLYVAAKQGGEDVLYVFDTEKGLWHKEDGAEVERFVKIGENLSFISGGKVFAVNLDAVEDVAEREETSPWTAEKVSWMAETGNIGLYTDGYKRIVKVNLRAQIPFDGEIVVEVSHDDGEYETVKRISGRGIGMTTVPVYPRRCDHFKLKFRGTGDCRIISLVKTLEGGSDVGK